MPASPPQERGLLLPHGDGATSSATNPSHTYTTPGIYSVSLSVANAFGGDSVTSIDLVCVH
ncbi:MAG: PKD domain-containing protein, partial [Miltoncostaeaceae bacterium]